MNDGQKALIDEMLAWDDSLADRSRRARQAASMGADAFNGFLAADYEAWRAANGLSDDDRTGVKSG